MNHLFYIAALYVIYVLGVIVARLGPGLRGLILVLAGVYFACALPEPRIDREIFLDLLLPLLLFVSPSVVKFLKLPPLTLNPLSIFRSLFRPGSRPGAAGTDPDGSLYYLALPNLAVFLAALGYRLLKSQVPVVPDSLVLVFLMAAAALQALILKKHHRRIKLFPLGHKAAALLLLGAVYFAALKLSLTTGNSALLMAGPAVLVGLGYYGVSVLAAACGRLFQITGRAREQADNFAGGRQQNRGDGSSGDRLKTGPFDQYFALLDLPVGADFETVKKRRMTLLKIYHTDKNPEGDEASKYAEEKAKLINQAFDKLKTGYFKKKS